MSDEIARQMLALHADMVGEGDELRQLLEEKVSLHTILSLYPMNADEWARGLSEHFRGNSDAQVRYAQSLNTHFMRLAPEQEFPTTVNFFGKMSAEHGNYTHSIYKPMGEVPAAVELTQIIMAQASGRNAAEKIQKRFQSICARMTIARHWGELPELHPFERQYIQVLAGMRWMLSL